MCHPENDRPAREMGEITPQAVATGRAVLHSWLRKWDYLAEGMPSDDDVDLVIRSILGSTQQVNTL
jgi:hypothetical protein